MVIAVKVNAEGFFCLHGDRIEKSEALDEAAIPLVAAIGDDDVVEGPGLVTIKFDTFQD